MARPLSSWRRLTDVTDVCVCVCDDLRSSNEGRTLYGSYYWRLTDTINFGKGRDRKEAASCTRTGIKANDQLHQDTTR